MSKQEFRGLERRETQVDPRREMSERLPESIQPLLTALTGKAGPDDVEIRAWTPSERLVATIAELAVGVAGGAAAVAIGGPALVALPVTTLMAAAAARTLQTSFVHHASHGRLVPSSKRWNRFWGEVASVLAWLQPLEDYEPEHKIHHNQLATEADPDLVFVRDVLGFKGGAPRAESWRRLRRLIVSPKFHLSRTLARAKANLIDASPKRRAASWAYLALLLGGTASTGAWLPMLVGYVLPVIVLQNVGAVLQTLSEHAWVHLGYGRDSKSAIHRRLTFTRYSGESLPVRGSGPLAWIRWWAAMLLVHGPLKHWITGLDLGEHLLHHIEPNGFDWARFAFSRREHEAKLAKGEERVVWGLFAALDLTFAHLELLPEGAELGDPEGYGWIDPRLLDM
ncbi:MAG: fatty acid desaturase [Isosphaeraceae bacterium]|nr:fatty acid desaturase [Isosphaeraceae bacterium]